MCKFIKQIGPYKILKLGEKSYIVTNTQGKYENHGHFKKENTCYLIIKLIDKRQIPKSRYLIESARRITTCERYKKELELKQEKNRQKQYYFNPSKKRQG